MFFHNFKYSLKTLLRNKGLIFWTFAFPIILGTLFNLAFSDIENKETLDIIDIAIVNNEEFKTDTYFTESFKVLSKKKDPNQLFNIKYTNLSTAKTLLKENKITGYLLFENNDVKITVNDKGYHETILRFVVDELSSQKEMLETITTKEVADSYKSGNLNVNYEKIYQDTLNLINNTTPKLNNISNSNLSYTMIEYYTLLAMACLYGALISMFVTNKKIANMSSAGKRTSVSPANKKTLLLGSFLASYLVQLLGILILYLYTIFVIKVDYGSNTFLVFLLLMAGSLAGLTLGIAISTRPDCLSDEWLDYLEDLNKKTFLIVELGLQSSNDNTLRFINRGHDSKTFKDAVDKLHERNIFVVAHIINGLPYETKEDMINTIKFVNGCKVDGIKIHMLYIEKNTPLASLYETNKFHILTREEYIDIVCSQLRLLNEDVVVMRITGDPILNELVAPEWLIKKFMVLNGIDQEMVKRNIYQGDLF